MGVRRKASCDVMFACTAAMAKLVLGTSSGISEQRVYLTASCTHRTERRIQKDLSPGRCDRTEGSCPYRSLTDGNRNCKSTLVLETF